MLHSLTHRRDYETFSVSPENPTGEKGRGGMAVTGSASGAARELGQGWKVNPFLVVQPGETAVLADIRGQGAAVKQDGLIASLDDVCVDEEKEQPLNAHGSPLKR